jgi:uncharacterized protein (DUF433 family)
MRKNLGRYVVVDSKICRGQPTFRGTPILVKDVLDQIAAGINWDEIVNEGRGSIEKIAIAEAIRSAVEALLRQAEESTEVCLQRTRPSQWCPAGSIHPYKVRPSIRKVFQCWVYYRQVIEVISA